MFYYCKNQIYFLCGTKIISVIKKSMTAKKILFRY